MRITGRIPKEIPIVLIGSDLDGKVFSEPTNTVLLSLHGAGIVSRHKLSPEQELILRCPDRNTETAIRIVGQMGASNGVYTYGLAFVDPQLNFWTAEFPPLTPAEIEQALVSLACSSCKTVEKMDKSSPEAGLLSANKSLLRFCKHCGFSTLWKPAPAVVAANPEVIPLSENPAAPSSPVPASPSFSPAPPAPSTYSSPFSAPVQPSLQDLATSQSTAYHASSAHPEPGKEPRATVLTLPPPARVHEAPRVDRRQHPRAKVSYSALVRHPERGDDIVQCEDMSRGGLRFKSKKVYYERSLIEIAVPYVAGQTLIFAPAQIVSAVELPAEKLFRYGVAYLQRPKPTSHSF
jgi:hypothetical protein